MRLVVFAAAVAVGLIACNGTDLSLGGGPADILNIAIGDDYFKADSDTIPVTDTITWTVDSASKETHDVTWDAGPSPLPDSSGPLTAGHTYVTGFANPGFYKYHCSRHPGMTGLVGVLVVPGANRKTR